MSDKPNIADALHAIETLDDFIIEVNNCLKSFLSSSAKPSQLVPTHKMLGMDVIIDNDMPDDRIDFLLDGEILSSIHFDDDTPNLHIGMDGRLKYHD